MTSYRDHKDYTLMPSNSTRLEKDLAFVILKSFDGLMSTAKQLQGIKYKNIPDSLIPWLLEEYGLTEIAGILDGPRLALEKGKEWSKIRGTEASVLLVLEWLGVDVKKIHTNGPGNRFAEYEVELNSVPNNKDIIYRLIKGVQLSQPVRCKLTRVSSGYRKNKFILSKSPWGDILSGVSGKYLPDLELQVSFRQPYLFLLDKLDFSNIQLDTKVEMQSIVKSLVIYERELPLEDRILINVLSYVEYQQHIHWEDTSWNDADQLDKYIMSNVVIHTQSWSDRSYWADYEWNFS